MDETEAKPDEETFDKKTEFFKMMLGIGAGWVAKELVETGYVKFVKWHRRRTTKTE